MKRTTLLYLVSLLIVVAMVWLTVRLLPKEIQQKQIAETVSVSDAAEYFSAGAFLLDVREQSEWEAGHIEGAVLIPLAELPNRMTEVPKDKIVLVICRSGNRSAQARDQLRAAGYTQVTSIDGGMNAWIQAGLPVVTGP
jgi:rhodanese-related sulfurtransferase